MIEDPHDRLQDLPFVLLDDHAQSAAVQADEAAGRVDPQGADKGLDQRPIKVVLAPFEELAQGWSGGHAL